MAKPLRYAWLGLGFFFARSGELGSLELGGALLGFQLRMTRRRRFGAAIGPRALLVMYAFIYFAFDTCCYSKIDRQ